MHGAGAIGRKQKVGAYRSKAAETLAQGFAHRNTGGAAASAGLVRLLPATHLLNISIPETDFVTVVPAAFVRVVSPFSIDSGLEGELR